MLTGWKTYIGLLIAAMPAVANMFGYSVVPGFEDTASSIADQILEVIGLGIALYGRLKAETPGLLVKNK